jgi:predicted enzyme related to lactoylglutathione lyase
MDEVFSRRKVMAAGAATAFTAPMLLSPALAAPGVRSGFQEVVVSVFDFAFLTKPFVATGDYVTVPLPDAPHAQWSCWNVPDSCTRIEQVMLRHKTSPGGSGSMRLVKFHGVQQEVMRTSQRSWDTGGIFDVDMYARDDKAMHRLLQQHGWTAMGEPVEYRENIVHVWQSVDIGPNGFMLALIQRISPPIVAPPFSMVSPIFNSTQMVADIERAFDYYTRILGWTMGTRWNIDNQAEPGADVLGLPLPQAETAKRFLGGVSLIHDGARASVELIENRSMHGRRFDDRCVAPNVGILSLRIPVADARRYANEIEGRGGHLYSPPQSLTVAPYGKVNLFSVRSPEGAIVEFFSNA